MEDRDEWVGKCVATLDAGKEADVDRAYYKLRDRMDESRIRPMRLFRWAGVALATSIGTIVLVSAGSLVWAQMYRNTGPYVFEADQEYVRLHRDGEELRGREWIRIRSDGAHVITGTSSFSMFVTATRIEWPGGWSEAFIDPFPIPIHSGQSVPRSALVAANCHLGGHPGEVVGTETIYGYEAVVVQRMVTGNRRLTTWLVPSLGCATLQMREDMIHHDGRVQTLARRRTIAIRTGK